MFWLPCNYRGFTNEKDKLTPVLMELISMNITWYENLGKQKSSDSYGKDV